MKQESGRQQPGIPFLQGGEDVKPPEQRTTVCSSDITEMRIKRMIFTLLDGTTVRRPWGAYCGGIRASQVAFDGLDFHTLCHWPGDQTKRYLLECVAPRVADPDPDRDDSMSPRDDSKAPEGIEGHMGVDTTPSAEQQLADALEENTRLREEAESLRSVLTETSAECATLMAEKVSRQNRERADQPGKLSKADTQQDVARANTQQDVARADADTLAWLRVNGGNLSWLVGNMGTLRKLVGTTQMAEDMARHTDQADTIAAMQRPVGPGKTRTATPPHRHADIIRHLADQMVEVGPFGRKYRARLASNIKSQVTSLEQVARSYYDLD